MKIECKETSEVDSIISILQQHILKREDETYPDKEWLNDFLLNGLVYGCYLDAILVGVIIAEKLLNKGAYIWYVAIKEDKQEKGLGTILLKSFELYAKKENIEWLKLNATPNAEKFYDKNGYITGSTSNVREYSKKL